MTGDPPILGYAPPPRRRVRLLARLPAVVTVLAAVPVPGFASMLLGAPRGGRTFGLLTGGVAAAFAFFGPVWGELLFKGTPRQDAGLVPFLVFWAVCVLLSVVTAARDWVRVRRAARCDL